MPGIDVNILFSALFTLLGMAGSIGVVLFVGGRWTARIEDRLSAVENTLVMWTAGLIKLPPIRGYGQADD